MSKKSIIILLLGGGVIVYFLKDFFFSSRKAEADYGVELTKEIDPDIILVNIQEGDRAFIGNLLLSIDSCKPFLIAIDVLFVNETDKNKDSILVNALKVIQNDIMAYSLDTTGKVLPLNKKFEPLAKDKGLAVSDEFDGITTDMTPVRVIGNSSYESFALKIIKHWKPEFNHHFKDNELVPIKYTRTLDQFAHFDGSEMKVSEYGEMLKNKIVIVSYIGPSNEDKHFTPIRFVREYPDDVPDTYGAVIIANQIRTILKYKNDSKTN